MQGLDACDRCRAVSRRCYFALDPDLPPIPERIPLPCTKCAADGECCEMTL
jgi:hypothetical protein